jgi:hypothetical protein
MGRYIHIRSNVNNFYPFRIVGYICKGFNDDIYAIERDNTTKQHYLLKLDI